MKQYLSHASAIAFVLALAAPVHALDVGGGASSSVGVSSNGVGANLVAAADSSSNGGSSDNSSGSSDNGGNGTDNSNEGTNAGATASVPPTDQNCPGTAIGNAVSSNPNCRATNGSLGLGGNANAGPSASGGYGQ